MNGEPWKAGKFTLSLRLSLWSEHLGLQAGEVRSDVKFKASLLIQAFFLSVSASPLPKASSFN